MKNFILSTFLLILTLTGCGQKEPIPEQKVRELPYIPFIDGNATADTFEGRIIVEWIEERGSEERHMKLLEPFSYIDKDHIRWDVPAGHIVDGASIPQSLWSIVGSPYVGKYRKASVIHDYYCDVMTAPSKRVHKMFYDAMLASGVDEARALLMYQAVDNFGPSWEMKVTPEIFIEKPKPINSSLKEMMDKVRENNPSKYLEYLENRTK